MVFAKTRRLAAASIIIFWATTATAGYTVKPEKTAQVVLSNIDVNRIVCDAGKISDVFFSEEKGIVVSSRGRDAFVKVKMKRRVATGELIRPVLNVDLHIVCDGSVYTIIGQLKPVPAQTIHLSSGTGNMKKNIKMLGAMPEEKRTEWIIRAAYRNEYPETFIVKTVDKPFGDINGLVIDLKRQIRIEGLGLRLSEYTATATNSTAVSEGMFLAPEFGRQIKGVSLDTNSQALDQGDKMRVFILEKVGGDYE